TASPGRYPSARRSVTSSPTAARARQRVRRWCLGSLRAPRADALRWCRSKASARRQVYATTDARHSDLTATDCIVKLRGVPRIQLRGLTKRFGPVLAVDELSFDVASGSVTGFLGPNGAGKTTTLRMLLGLVEPTAGTATIHGRPFRSIADPLHHVGAVLEASSFYPGRTARNHLRVQAVAGGIEPARTDAVL